MWKIVLVVILFVVVLFKLTACNILVLFLLPGNGHTLAVFHSFSPQVSTLDKVWNSLHIGSRKNDLGVKCCIQFLTLFAESASHHMNSLLNVCFWYAWRSSDIATKQLGHLRPVQSISEETARNVGWECAVCYAGSVNMTTALLQNGHEGCFRVRPCAVRNPVTNFLNSHRVMNQHESNWRQSTSH